VGTNGYGSSATPLLTAANVTDANGNFTIGGDYTCPTASTLVYLTGTGGNPGLTAGTNNGALALMAALGPCGSLTASTFIAVNEVSTVASVYALAQFMNPATGAVGSYGYNNNGLSNAFGTVSNLVTLSTGAALAQTPNGNGVVPQAEINSLADILAACVNSSGSTSSGCSSLFTATTPAGGSAPANTLLAALSIALHPANNVASVFGQLSATPPFQPTLGSAPNDWTMALSYAASAWIPYTIAIDAGGNVWTANYATGATSSVSKLSSNGVPAAGSPFTLNANGTVGIAIDLNGNAWVTNNDNNTAVLYGSNGNTIAGPFSSIGLSGPKSVAVDANNNIWFSNSGNNTVTELGSGYGMISPNPGYAGGGLNLPQGIAIDGKGNAWIANAGSVTELNGFGTALSPSGGFVAGGDITGAQAITIDGANNVWVPSSTGHLVKLNSSGVEVSPSGGYSGGGLGSSSAVAIDGGGNAWVAGQSEPGFGAEFGWRGDLTVERVSGRESEYTGGAGNRWIGQCVGV
jgi:hypothetical protein